MGRITDKQIPRLSEKAVNSVQKPACIFRQMGRETDGHRYMDGGRDGWMDRSMDGWIDLSISRWMDR